jgi:glycosyltransferase involved in cell wall biosynthesis
MPGNDSLRIAQVCSAREAVYGAVQSLMTLARAQRMAGHEVEFITFKGKRFGSQVRDQGYVAHEVRVRTKIDMMAVLRMRRIIRDSVNGGLAARLAGVPSVATVHGMSGKLSFATADHLIAVSQQVRLHLLAQGVPEEKVSVVHNGLSFGFEIPNPALARRSIGLPTDALVVGTVSRVTPTKGIEDAIRAVALLKPEFPNLRYLVVGDGDGLPACRALVDDLHLRSNVRFVGYQKDIATYLSAMDLFLFPSHKEAMGIALVEAMAAGLPTVAVEVGGIPEVITPEVGLLRPARNPQALAAAVRDLLLDERARHTMGRNAELRAATYFSPTAMERSTDWVYRSLLEGNVSMPTPVERLASEQHVER